MQASFRFSMTSLPLTLKRAFQILAQTSAKAASITEAEVLLLAHFFALPSTFEFHRFSRSARVAVQKEYERMYGEEISMANIQAKLHSMKKKGFIIKQDDGQLVAVPYIKEFAGQVFKAYNENKEFTFLFSFSASEEKRDSNRSI